MSGEEEHQAKATASGETVETLRAHLSLNLKPPTNLDLSDNHRAENWKTFKQRWNHYSILTQLNRKPEEYMVALFLKSVGNETVKSFITFDLTDAEQGNLQAIIAAFDKFAVGEKNETYGTSSTVEIKGTTNRSLLISQSSARWPRRAISVFASTTPLSEIALYSASSVTKLESVCYNRKSFPSPNVWTCVWQAK